tara:strand:+ start:3348 stop:4151 length:804 start_codon:yes stop_codon:yes gene_type:complete
MAGPTSRAELQTYCKRQLGEPVLQINVAQEQIDDLTDDALQKFAEWTYNGAEKMLLKHEVTADDVTRFASSNQTTTVGTTDWIERDNYIQIPDHVYGINRIFGIKSSGIRGNLFGIEYQIFLNDLYHFGAIDILNYYMTKSYLETLDFVLNNGTFIQFRFNQRQDRLYLDTAAEDIKAGEFIIIECYRALDPTTYTQVFNDPFMKKYLTALIKKQWGVNLTKYQNMTLPGGITLNGEKIYQEAILEIEKIESQILSTYAIPPLDLIG